MEESQELQGEQVQNEAMEKEETVPSADAQKIAALETQLAQARQEAADNWNKFLRERADMDNFRKRQERVLIDRVQNQKKALLHKLLGVMDKVEGALVFQ